MITVTINGNIVPIINKSLKQQQTVDGRTIFSLTVLDASGTTRYYPGQPVVVADTSLGNLFSGYISTAQENNLQPNPDNEIAIQVSDLTYLADKRSFSGVDFVNRYAGDIATELAVYLSEEGVQTSYAIDRDISQADFSEGVLSGVVATTNNGGDLELAPAGTNTTILLSQTTIPSMQALKFTGAAYAGYINNYTYRMIYNLTSSPLTIVSGDYLQYEVWIQSNSPAIMCGLDFICTDGTTFRDSTDAGMDQQGIGPHPSNDLSGYANDQWYSRLFSVGATLYGKKIAYFSIAFEGNNAGTYTAYVRRAFYGNGATHKIDIMTDTTSHPQINQQISINGYSNVVLSTVAAHDKTYNTFFNLQTSTIGYLKNSNAFFSPSDVTSYLAPDAQFIIQHSVDVGSSRQVATNGASIPNLLPGSNLNNRNIFEWKYVIQGIDPTASTTVPQSFIVLQSAPANNGITNASDVIIKYDLNTEWDTGTYSNTRSGGQSNLQMAGQLNSFSTTPNAVTSFGALGQYILRSTLAVNTNAEGKLRLDFAGSWQNFTAEMDILVGAAYTIGLVYRTTGWQSNNNTFAYSVSITTNQLLLARGTNSATGTGTLTNISTVTMGLTDQSWHHLTIQVNGSSHTVLIDGIQYINSTDTTYSGTGQIGIRMSTGGSSIVTSQVKNFGVINGLSGTWTSPLINLSPAQIAGKNLIAWDNSQSLTDGLSYITEGSSITIQTSLDGGSTWATATNGAPIPGITTGQSLSGINLSLRATLATSSASNQPTLGGLSIWLCPQYQSVGYRITPPLNLLDVRRAGSSLVSWTGIQPPNTSINIDTSLDDFTFTNIGSGASGGASIANIYTPPDPFLDDFTDYTPILYNATSINTSSGILGSWTYDSLNNRIIAISPGVGSGCLFLYKNLNTLDTEISTIMDAASASGLLLRYTDINNFYYCILQDSAYSDPNKIKIYKVAAGTTYPLGSYTINFPHNTPHVVKFSCINNILSLTYDGSIIASIDDSMHTPLTAGLTGFYNDGGTANYYYFRAQAWGQDVTGGGIGLQNFTRVRLTSTDPTVTPAISDLSTSIHNSNILNGALIPSTNYSILNGSTNTLAADLDDLAKQSDYFWIIRDDYQFIFQSRIAQMAPWAVTSNDVLRGSVQVNNVDDNYRNSEWIKGGVDIVPAQQSFIGDNVTTSWSLGYNIASIQSITINNIPATFGIKSASTGKNFYYDVGSNAITQDSSGTPLNAAQTLTIVYQGQANITINITRDDAVAARAAIDNSSGLIEVVEDGKNLNKQAVITLADSKLSQFCREGRTLQFDTLRDGLAPGQLITVFIPQHGLTGDTFLITDISTTWETLANGQLQPIHTVQTTDGAIVGDWSRFFLNLSKF